MSRRQTISGLRTVARHALLAMQMLLCGFAFVFSQFMISRKTFVLDILSLNNLCIFFGILMYASMMRAGRFGRVHRLMMALIAVSALYLFSDGVFWHIDGVPELAFWNRALNTIYNLCPLVMVMLFWRLLGELRENTPRHYDAASKAMYALGFLGVAFMIGNLFGGYYFTVSGQTGRYARGVLYHAYLILPALISVNLIAYIVMRPMSLLDKLILLSYPLIPYANLVAGLWSKSPTFLSVCTFMSLFFLYTNLFVRTENDLLVRDKALTDSRLKAVQMQINPHFLFNALTSVAGLCESDPPAAQEMVYELSDYLRDNYTGLTGPSMIPFREELTHLEHYLAIERTRFPDIEVRFDIREETFFIPSMTLQPLVENAIKHGIRKRRGSKGTITVTSEASEDAYIVHILDDGVGFSASEAPTEGVHIGIQNVRTRLELLCDGTLEVVSAPGRGTACRVRLPKKWGGKTCSRYV